MMLIEEYALGGCRPANMVATAHNMSDGREERVARYKEERRRELEARYGPRISSHQDIRNDSREKERHESSRLYSQSFKEQKTADAGKDAAGRTSSDGRSPSDAVRSTKASRLRTQANALAQGHISRIPQPDPLRPKSGDFTIESVHKDDEGEKVVRRKWKVTRSLTVDSSPTSQQSSANSSPNNERKARGRYNASRSLSPGGMANALANKTKASSGSPSIQTTQQSQQTSPLPRSSQLVRKANNSRLSPGRRVESNVTKPSGAVPPASPRERKSSQSPARDRHPPSLLPLRQPSNSSCRVASEVSKFSDSAKYTESSRFSESSKFNDSSKFSESSKFTESSKYSEFPRYCESSKLDDDHHRVSSPQFSPVKHPASILKKSSLDESSSQPVSILKRKSSRDDGVNPVRWTTEAVTGRSRATVVLSNCGQATGSNSISHGCGAPCGNSGLGSNPGLSRGILKKHRSLDEPPHSALIVESANSHQNGNEEMRPILKGQGRRCSLEELKRNQSPEGHPQGILKRKTSSGLEEFTGCDINDTKEIPQSILKRKGSSPVRSHPASPVREAVFEDSRRPILKKKSSSEEPPDSPLLEPSHPPRPILKKKSLDEEESLTVRPILKTKNDESTKSEIADIKPILKHSEDEPSPVVFRSNSVRSYQNRRSLDPNFVYMRPRSPTDDRPSRPLSIAERISHLEFSLEQDLQSQSSGRNSRMDDGDSDGGESNSGLSRSGSVSERASMWNKLEQESRAAAQMPRRISKGGRGRTARGEAPSRFSTQPVTLGEVEQARRNNQQQQQQQHLQQQQQHLLQQQQQLDCVDEDDEPSRLSLAERVRLFSGGSSQDSRGTPPLSPATPQPPTKVQLPPVPRRQQPITHSATSSIVSGLLKNLRDKAGTGSTKERANLKTSKSGWESSEDEAASTDSSDTESSASPCSSPPPRHKINMVVGMVGGGGVVVRRCATEQMDRVRASAAAPDPCKDSDESDGTPVVTIADRLAALQRSGSTDWRKRVKPSDNGDPNGGVAARLGKLETASQEWKARVEVKDNLRFTVAGKMGSVPSSPVTLLPPQIRSQPQPQVFSPQGVESMSTPVSPDMGDSVLSFIKRSASAPGSDHLKRILNGSSGCENPGPIVTVPEVCDENFHSFFPGYMPPSLQSHISPTADLENIDFEHLSNNSTQLLVSKRRVRAQRKHISANPLRALAQRSDLRTEYVEVRSGVAEKERIRLNLDKLSKTNPGLAVEALAGLASKEELTSVVLRRSADSGPVKQVAQWCHPLLLRTKGRRHPVTCIVPACYSSINQGDAFILVTSTQVFCWVGEFCNVIEKSRATEVASEIQARRDIGCLSASKVTNLDGTASSPQHDAFWQILKLPQDQMATYKGEPGGHPEEDEFFETTLSQTYRVYELSKGALIPVEHAWARHPKIEILEPTKVMVFDFVTEVFCWCGKGSSVTERKLGSKLANELAKVSSAWEPCGLPWLDTEIKKKTLRVYSVTQHMEPILFREKFTDWPDFNRNNIGHKGENGLSHSDGNKSCDIKPMMEWSIPQPDLVLETSHLGRGYKFYDSETRRYYQVSTQGVKLWRIEDYSPVEIPESNYGHFFDTHSYIVQWKYTLTVTGRELSGEPSKHQALGRDRIAYLTWQGRRAGLEGGAAALLTVGMQQGAPQIMVREGLEPPAFQQLIPCPAIVIHSERLSGSWPKLYLIEPGQDNMSNESPLVRQLPAEDSALRSSASFLYLPRATCTTGYVWHGASTRPHFRDIAYDAACQLMSSPSPHFKLTQTALGVVVATANEGSEPKDFFNGVVLRKSYSSEFYSNPEDMASREFRLKMFELTVVKGVYTAIPVPPVRFNPEARSDMTWRFVYSQEELYGTVSQCVLVDASPKGGVWLWLRATSPTPSAQALTTQLAYSVARSAELDQVWVVAQGTEPTRFRTLFPWWSSDLSNEVPEGWNQGEMRLSTEEVAKFSIRTYPLHDLTSSPLPAGVNPTRLERYLSEPQFNETFAMSREDFAVLPSWKRKTLKKAANLF